MHIIGTEKICLQIGKVFQLEDIVEAHRWMDGNKAAGKIVVLTQKCSLQAIARYPTES